MRLRTQTCTFLDHSRANFKLNLSSEASFALVGDSPQSLQTLQHVPLDVLVFLVALQQRDGIVVVLAVDLVYLLQLGF